MTDIDTTIAELRVLLEASAATGRPWECDDSNPDDVVVWGRRDPQNPEHEDGNFVMNIGASRVMQVGVAFDMDVANGRLLVAAVNAIPALLAEIERLRAPRCEHDGPCHVPTCPRARA